MNSFFVRARSTRKVSPLSNDASSAMPAIDTALNARHAVMTRYTGPEKLKIYTTALYKSREAVALARIAIGERAGSRLQYRLKSCTPARR